MDDKQLDRVAEVLQEKKAKERVKAKEKQTLERPEGELNVRAKSSRKGPVTADKWNQ